MDINELQFRISTAADLCAILKETAYNTRLSDKDGIERVCSGIAILSQCLDEAAAMAQTISGITDSSDLDTIQTLKR